MGEAETKKSKTIHKFLDTSNLVKYDSGNNKGKINWNANIGNKLYFEYRDLYGYIEIVNHTTKKSHTTYYLDIKYNEKIYHVEQLQFKNLGFLSKAYRDIKNKEKEEIKLNKIKEKQEKENAIQKERESQKIIKKQNSYKYKIGEIYKNGLDEQVIKERIDIKNRSGNSSKGYLLHCTFCGYEHLSTENNMSSCPICGKRSSFPERFIYNILIQSNIEFIPQATFDWVESGFSYDAYMPNYSAIIEINGQVHYKPIKKYGDKAESIYLRNLERDKYKQIMANKNKLKLYIIDARCISNCTETTMTSYLRNMDTFINNIKETLRFIDFSKINFFEAEKFANYKLLIDVCRLWNEGKLPNEISILTNTSEEYVRRKLLYGKRYDMCNFDPDINKLYRMIYNPNKK